MPTVALFVALLAGAATGQEIRYEIEFLDRDAIETPGDALPAGGTILVPYAAISRNGRWMAGLVHDDRDPAAPVHLVYRLERDTGAVDVLEQLQTRSGPTQVNDHGHVIAYANAVTPPETMFWSEGTGVLGFGPSMPPFSPESPTLRTLNGHDDVLLRPLPLEDEDGPTGGALWNPVLETTLVVPNDSRGLNDQGLVVGKIGPASEAQAFIWEADTGPVPLSSPVGSPTVAFHVDESGAIVGAQDLVSGPEAVLWPSPDAEPVALPCPEVAPGLVIECAATYLDPAGRIYGGGAFEDHEPGVQVVWDGGEPHLLDELLLDPDASCAFFQVADLGELSAYCLILDPELPWPDSIVRQGPAVLRPVFPGLRVTVTSPVDGAVVPEGLVPVTGTASDDSGIVSVTVEGIPAALAPTGNPEDPAEVAFEVPLLLCPGPHGLLVVATDEAGNTVSERLAIDVVPGETSCDGGPPELDCSFAVASPDTLWPPNHHLEAIEILGVTTADGTAAELSVLTVRQDEPVEGLGDGDTGPDALLGEGGEVSLRCERSGAGDGRVYEIEFEATDGPDSCTGSVLVGVPHDQGLGSVPVDSGERHDSTSPMG